jgi:hypothetical protein
MRLDMEKIAEMRPFFEQLARDHDPRRQGWKLLGDPSPLTPTDQT